MRLENAIEWLTKVFYEGFYYGVVNYGRGHETIEDPELRELAGKAVVAAKRLEECEIAIENRARELDLETEF